MTVDVSGWLWGSMISLRDALATFHYRVARLFLRLRRDEAAAKAFGRAFSVEPDDAHVLFHQAWCLLYIPRRREEGITAFEKLVRVSPSAAAFFHLGCGFQQESRHEEAVQAFQQATQLETPGTAALHYNYAISLAALGRLGEAADAYANAAHLDPLDAEAWGNLGAALADLGRWRDAAPCQDRAMRLDPCLTHGLNFAATLYELDRLDEAERVLRDLLVLNSRSTDAQELLAQVLAGQDRYEEALKIAHDNCASSSGALSSRATLAVVLSAAGYLDEAVKEASAAAKIDPQDARVHSAFGTVYVQMNNGPAALAAFERMAECLVPEPDRRLSPPWISCLAGRGAALSLLGRHDDAVATFDELLRTDPEFLERWPELAAHYRLSARAVGGKSNAGSP